MQKMVGGEKLQTQCLVGYVTHEDYITVIMNFVEFVIVNSKVPLSFDNIEKMYNYFVVRAVTEFESN